METLYTIGKWLVFGAVGIYALSTLFRFIASRILRSAAVECIDNAMARFNNDSVGLFWTQAVNHGLPQEKFYTRHILEEMTKRIVVETKKIQWRLKNSGAIYFDLPIYIYGEHSPVVLLMSLERINWLFNQTFREYTGANQARKGNFRNVFSYELSVLEDDVSMLTIRVVICTKWVIPVFDTAKILAAQERSWK